METIRDLLTASLRKIGVLAAGETMSSANGQDAFTALKLMVDAMANESLLIPVTTVLTHTLIEGQPDYTVGIYPSPRPDPLPSNHIESAKPTEYLSGFIRDAGNTDYLIHSFIPANQYDAVGQKGISGRPAYLYVQDGWPMDTLRLVSAPYENDTLYLTCKLPLSELLPTTTINHTIDLPPGYKSMLLYNLCIELAPEWERSVSNEIAMLANKYRKEIKGQNFRAGKLRSDAPRSNYGRGRYYNVDRGPV